MVKILVNVVKHKRYILIFCYFGHHKCGTAWIRRVVRDICRQAGWNNVTVYDHEISLPGLSFDAYLKKEKADFLCYTDADFERVKELDDFKGFHVIRDPRDIIVSAYFSHLYSHMVEGWPELVLHREKLKSVSKDEGLLLEMEFSKPSLDQMGKWNYANPNVLEIKMEELMVEPEKMFLKIFSYLGALHENEPTMTERLIMAINPLNQRGRGKLPFGWPLSPIRFPLNSLSEDTIRNVVEANSFSRLSKGRKQGEEDSTNHYRKGVAGDWVNHFKPQHVERFSSLYGALLKKLGYE